VRLVWILTETVFERSTSVDIIRVSAGVTVTVESKEQIWRRQSLPHRYLCVGCQENSLAREIACSCGADQLPKFGNE